jgi:hypothetical protein
MIQIQKKFQIKHPKRHIYIFDKISKMIFLAPEFSQEIWKFQNSEYEVHQSSPYLKGSKYLKSVAIKASIQISANKIWQRRVTDGFLLSTYEIWKVLDALANFFLLQICTF